LTDPSEYVRRPEERAGQLRLLAEGHRGARVLILGHTHRRAIQAERDGQIRHWLRHSLELAEDDRYMINPGSIGQSRGWTARARFALIDLDSERAYFHAIRYDIGGCRLELARRGLPTWSMHIRPRPVRNRIRRISQVLSRGR
jgi:predicted phosphodiesterase